MAFLADGEPGESFDFVQRANETIQRMNNVAEERDRVFTENEGKELKIFGMGIGIALAIYYLLIKR